MRFRLLALALLLAAPAGAAPPDFSTKTLGGFPFALAAAHGRVVIVNFWATWCAPCRAEMPALDAFYRAHHGEGLELVAVSVDAGASIRKLQAATAGYVFPVARLADTRLPRAAIPTLFPTTRIYDRSGTLRFETGKGLPPVLDEATLARMVGPLLAEK